MIKKLADFLSCKARTIAGRWRRHLVRYAAHLGSEVGVIFRDVVLTLLKGLDRRGESKKDFYWDVVAQVQKCRA